MKITFFLAFLLIALSYNFISNNSDGHLPDVKSYYDGPLFHYEADTGVSCTAVPPNTSVIRDDGTYENGYRSVSEGDSTTMVHKMVLGPGRTIISVCWALTALSPSGSLTHNIIIYDTTGPGGEPGNVVARVANVQSPTIAIFPNHSRYSASVNIGPLPQRAYYIGVQWDNNPILPFFCSADENGVSGGPGYQRMGSSYPPNWGLNMPVFTPWDNWSFRVELAPPVGINGNSNQLPTQYILNQNFPNPFNPSTTVEFALPKAGNVSISVYDIRGNEVYRLINKTKYDEGNHKVVFGMSKFASGVYFYKFEAGDFRDTKKMMFIK